VVKTAKVADQKANLAVIVHQEIVRPEIVHQEKMGHHEVIDHVTEKAGVRAKVAATGKDVGMDRDVDLTRADLQVRQIQNDSLTTQCVLTMTRTGN
jgi:hypothetical protein